MDIELFQQFLADFLIRPAPEQHAFGDDHAGAAALGEVGHDVLDKEAFRGAGVDAEIGLQGLVHLAPIGRIGKDHVVLGLFGDVLGVNLQSVGQLQVGAFDAVQDHVHGAQKIGQRLDLHAVKRVLLEVVELLAAEVSMPANIIRGFAQKTGRAETGIVDPVARFGLSPPRPWRG